MRYPALFLAATALAALTGCGEAPLAPTSVDAAPVPPALLAAIRPSRVADDAELARLTERVRDLKARVTAAGRLTTTHQAELAQLGAEVTSWNIRTGRTDIAVADAQAARRSSVPTGSDTGGCSTCPIVTNDSPGKVCFLKGIGSCIPVGDELWPVCYYLCFDIATGTPDLGRR